MNTSKTLSIPEIDKFPMATIANDLNGKVIIVTGGAVGSGRNVVLLLAEAGASVVIADTDENHGEDTAMEAKKRGGDAMFVKADITEMNQIHHIVSKTLEKFGRIDVLVNNAGVEFIADVEETEEFDFDRVIDVNFKGAFFCSRAVIAAMKKQGGGVIINVASVSAYAAQPNCAAYAGTKGAVVSMTRAMSIELVPYNIMVNSVSPGVVETPTLRSDMERQLKNRGISFEEVKGELANKGLIKRFAGPDEIAPIILFLCSDKASHITGVDFLVDGGWVS